MLKVLQTTSVCLATVQLSGAVDGHPTRDVIGDTPIHQRLTIFVHHTIRNRITVIVQTHMYTSRFEISAGPELQLRKSHVHNMFFRNGRFILGSFAVLGAAVASRLNDLSHEGTL
jgi:hypothetical protein